MTDHLPATHQQHIATQELPYHLIHQGAVSAIADEQDNPLSGWFHEFKAFEDKDETGEVTVRGLIGVLGANEHIIKLPGEESSRLETVTDGYHHLDYRFDIGAFTGTSGAMTYVLDETGAKRTSGYHQIFVDGAIVYGKTGGGAPEPLFGLNPELPPEAK